MKRSLFALPFVFGLFACGGATGDERREPANENQAASTCAIAPGEDVCGRFSSEAPKTLSSVASVTLFAGRTRAVTQAMAAACEALATELGGGNVVAPAEACPLDRMTRVLVPAARYRKAPLIRNCLVMRKEHSPVQWTAAKAISRR